MAFNPELPANYAPVVAPELRDQFNGLKAIIDQLAGRVTILEAQVAAKPGAPEVSAQITTEAARNVDNVAALPPPWSQNPPERDEFNEVRDKVNEVLGGLKHPA